MSDHQKHLRELRDTKLRRLQVLELQSARYGVDCPAHIILEIEGIRKEVDQIQREMNSENIISTNNLADKTNIINITGIDKNNDLFITSNLGKFKIEGILGRGGMSIVYQAHDPILNRKVAIKVLTSELSRLPGFKDQFAKEAQFIAGLHHPNIISIYEYNQSEDSPFLVMPLMDNGTLAELMLKKSLSLDEIVNIITQVCAALDKAHARGVVHCDLKPSNILFDQDWHTYLADFGIARLTHKFKGDGLGTPEYMAPEQIRLETIDHRTDIYQLGVILFQLLTGKIPFSGSTIEEIKERRLFEKVPSVQSINPFLKPGFQTIIEKALSENKEDRYQTAGAFAHALSLYVHLVGPTQVIDYGDLTQYSNPLTMMTIKAVDVVLDNTQSMTYPQLVLITLTVLISVSGVTWVLKEITEKIFPFWWSFLGTSYFALGIIVYFVSKKWISIPLIHIPLHIIVLLIDDGSLLYNTNTNIFVLSLSAIFGSAILCGVLFPFSIPLWLIFPLIISSAFSVNVFCLSFIGKNYYNMWIFVGSIIIGLLVYVIYNINTGIQGTLKARKGSKK